MSFLLSLFGIGKAVLQWVAVIFQWLLDMIRRHPWPSATFAALIAFAWAWHGWDGALVKLDRERRVSQSWKISFIAQRTEMRKFGAAVKAARVNAARLDAANVARVKRDSAQIAKEQVDAAQKDLAAARAGLARWMRERSGAGGDGGAGSGSASDLPAVSALPEGSVQGGAAAVGASVLDACTVNTVNLRRLIAAWNAQAGIDVNGETP